MSVTTGLRAATVLTMGPAGTIPDGMVVVRDGAIVDVGPYADLAGAVAPERVEHHPDGVLLPGLVSTHGHFSEAMLAGTSDARSLLEWKDHVLAPTASLLTREHAEVGTILAACDLVRSGVTTVSDMFVTRPAPSTPVTPGVVDGLEEVGLRGVVAFGAKDVGPQPVPVADVLAEHDALRARCEASSRSWFRLGLANTLSASPALLAATGDRRRHEGAAVHVHAHEVREEIVEVQRGEGCRPIEQLARNGVLDEAIVAHAVWLSRADVGVLADVGAGVAHNPVSNMLLASGACDLDRLSAAGVPIGLGVDGAASNDRQDLLEVVKAAILLRRVTTLRADSLTAVDALRMATVGGAAVLGLADQIGSLTPGRRADLVLVGTGSGRLPTPAQPETALALAATAADVRRVWVDGELVVDDGVVRGVDEAEIRRRAGDLAVPLRAAIAAGGARSGAVE